MRFIIVVTPVSNEDLASTLVATSHVYYRISGIFRVGLIFAEFATSLKSPKIDTAKNKPYYTSSLRVLEIAKIGLSENLTHLPSVIFAKISRREKFPIYGMMSKQTLFGAIRSLAGGKCRWFRQFIELTILFSSICLLSLRFFAFGFYCILLFMSRVTKSYKNCIHSDRFLTMWGE